MRLSLRSTALLLSPLLLELGHALDYGNMVPQPTGLHSADVAGASICKPPAVTPLATALVFQNKKRTVKKRTGKGNLILMRNLVPRQNSGTVEYYARGSDCKKIEIHADNGPPGGVLHVTLLHHGDDKDTPVTMTPKPITVSKIDGVGTLTTSYTTTKIMYSFKPESSSTNPDGKKIAGTIVAGAVIEVVAVDATGEEISVAVLEEGAAEIPGEEVQEEEGGPEEEEEPELCKLNMDLVSSAAEDLWSTLRSMGSSAFRAYVLAPPATKTTSSTKPAEPTDGITCGTSGKTIDYNWWLHMGQSAVEPFAAYGIDDTNQIYQEMPLPPQNYPPDPSKPDKPWPSDGDRIFFKIWRSNGPNCPAKVNLRLHGFDFYFEAFQKKCAIGTGRDGKTTYGGEIRHDCWRVESWGIPNEQKEKNHQGLGWRTGS